MSKEHEDFGLSKDEADKAKEVLPTLNLGQLNVGQSIKLRVLDEKPREVEYEDKESGEVVKRKVLTVFDKLIQMKQTMWLSSKSLQMEMYKIYRQIGTLKDVDIIVAVREYKHDQYGMTRAYTVQVDNVYIKADPADVMTEDQVRSL